MALVLRKGRHNMPKSNGRINMDHSNTHYVRCTEMSINEDNGTRIINLMHTREI